MNKLFLRVALLGGFAAVAGVPVSVAAAERTYAVVDQVQMPAWLERGGQRRPLEAGRKLQNRDRIITGDEGRVVVQLAEGSVARLGEKAQLDVNALGWRENRMFTAAFDVAKGAFRLTTGSGQKTAHQRAVNVRVATITAGVRETDLWGRADAERDVICLLEGRATVVHSRDTPRELSEASSCYDAAKEEAPTVVDHADLVQVPLWAAQTGVQSGGGYTRRGGRWSVELATVDGEADALALYDRAREAGYVVRIRPLAAEGGYRYALRVPQLASQEDANALARKLVVALELPSPRVARR